MNARLMMILFAVLVVVAGVVQCLPASQDESLFVGAVPEEALDSSPINPQDPQAFLKWRQIKKLLFLG